MNETEHNHQMYAGLSLFMSGTQFLITIMLAAAIAPDYNFNTSAISDLGVISSTALLFNISLVILGILNILGGYYYYTLHRSKPVFATFVIAGIGAMGAGIFPLNSGDLHSLFALAAFLFFNIQVLATSSKLSGPEKMISVIAGIIGLIYVVIMIIGDGGNPEVFGAIGHGGSERMIAYPGMIWLIFFGGYLLSD